VAGTRWWGWVIQRYLGA